MKIQFVVILAIFVFSIAVSDKISAEVLYTLEPGTTFQEGCVAPCMCPVKLSENVSGTFLLVPAGSDLLYDNYRLEAISWTVYGFNGEILHKITGKGTYRVGGEFALTHQLVLDIDIDGAGVQHLDSGLIPGDSAFPSIALTVSRGTPCLDVWMDIKAKPAATGVPYSLAPGTTFQEGCAELCACPITDLLKMTGTFLLVPASTDPLFTNYRLDAISWTVYGFNGEILHKISGKGTYRVGGEFALMHQLILDVDIDGGGVRHFDSGLVQGGSEFPTISIAVDLGSTCFNIWMNIKAIPSMPRVYRHYFPSIKEEAGWESYLTVQAKDPVPMCVTVSVFDMAGNPAGNYSYCDDAYADAPAIAPNARVAQRPCLVASKGSTTCSVPVEGSMVVETNVPAIATTNTIANYFEGFSIVESAKPRSVHNFPKAYDGPNNYQVYMLAQNIHATARNVTATLYGKNAASPGHGAKKTYTIPAYGTLKFRPSDVAGGIDFNGSVAVSSDGATPGDGLGPAIPAMCRYELGKEAMTIYESTVEQPALYFPTVKDGKFGGTMEYQNYLSVVNPGVADATVEVILHTNAGVKKATSGPFVITAGGKATWRPSMILGTLTAPVDFEGSIMVSSSAPVVGQTNTMYPGVNTYQCDAFDLFESAMPNTTLFFPKAFDNIVADGHLYDNVVYIQNPDAVAKNITIEQFNNNGSANGVRTVPLGPNATYVYRPKDLVTDGTATFRGSMRVTETGGGNIAGAIKYDLHQGTTTSTPVDAMTLYRSMGM